MKISDLYACIARGYEHGARISLPKPIAARSEVIKLLIFPCMFLPSLASPFAAGAPVSAFTRIRRACSNTSCVTNASIRTSARIYDSVNECIEGPGARQPYREQVVV